MAVDQIEAEKLNKAVLKSANILVKNGLGDWKIKVNNKRSTLAETHYRTNTIMYSRHFLLVADEDQFLGVTLHEVTHALLGKGHGHNKEFKKLCTKISPSPEYAQRSVNIPIRKFLLKCPECGYEGSTNVAKDRYCGVCWRNKKKTVIFHRKENLLKVKMW